MGSVSSISRRFAARNAAAREATWPSAIWRNPSASTSTPKFSVQVRPYSGRAMVSKWAASWRLRVVLPEDSGPKMHTLRVNQGRTTRGMKGQHRNESARIAVAEIGTALRARSHGINRARNSAAS
ncbi:hypothetical protein D3C72_1883780 [compost metagenome]